MDASSMRMANVGSFATSGRTSNSIMQLSEFSTTGKVLTAEERAKAARNKGVCPKCGIQTHAVSGPMRIKKRVSSYRVFNGICIGCNPDLVPPDVYEMYLDRKKKASLHGLFGDSAYDVTNGSDDDSSHGGNFNRRSALSRSDASGKLSVSSSSKLAAEAFLEARKKVHLPVSARRQVMESWKMVSDDLTNLGMDFFIKVFTLHPHLKSLFPFGDDPRYMSNDDLRDNPTFRAHAGGAMSMLGRAAAGLADMELLMPQLKELGRMHTNIGVLPEYYDLVYDALMDTVAKKVGPQKWTAETQEAWQMCYRLITSVMKGTAVDIEPPEGWGLVHAVSCLYTAVVTPFRLAGFGGIGSGPLTPALNVLDSLCLVICFLDGFSDQIEMAASLRKYRRPPNPDSILEESEDDTKKQHWVNLLRPMSTKMECRLRSYKYRISRYIRGMKLSQYSHWPKLDCVIVGSFVLQQSFLVRWARRSSGFEWIYFAIGILRCAALVRVSNYIHCAELFFLKRNTLTKERYQMLHIGMLVCALLYTIHVCGCLYAVVAQLAFLGGGDSDGDGLLDSGFAVKMHPLLESGRTLHAYLHGVYWAFTNVTGIGHHGGSPETSLEFVFAILVHLGGAGFYIIGAGHIMSLMQNRAESVYQVEEGISALTSFMDGCDIPKTGQDKFVSAYLMKSLVVKGDPIQDASRSSNEMPTSRPLVPDAAQQLPLHLSMELTLFSRAKALRTRGIKLASDDFAFAVVESLIQNMTLLPGDYLFQVGKKVTPRVILVDKGVLEVFIDGVSKGCLYPGDLIGKGWLATLPMENKESSRHKSFLDWRSSDGNVAIADVRAMTECRLVMGLGKRSEVAHLQTLFPQDMKKLAEQCTPSSDTKAGSKNWNTLRGKVLKHSGQSMPLEASQRSTGSRSRPTNPSGRALTPPPSSRQTRASLESAPSGSLRPGRSLSPKRSNSSPSAGPTNDSFIIGDGVAVTRPSTQTIQTLAPISSINSSYSNIEGPPITSLRYSASLDSSTIQTISVTPSTKVHPARGRNTLPRELRNGGSSTSVTTNGSVPTTVSDMIETPGSSSRAMDSDIFDSGRQIRPSRQESHRSLSPSFRTGRRVSLVDDSPLTIGSDHDDSSSTHSKTVGGKMKTMSKKFKGLNFLRLPKPGSG